MATTFLDETQGLGTKDGWTSPGASVTVDTTVKLHGYGSTKLPASGGNTILTPTASCADSGTRLSLWIYLTTYPGVNRPLLTFRNSGATAAGPGIGITPAGVLQIIDASTGAQLGSDGSTLALNTWNRIAIGYTITSTTVYTVKTWVNGAATPDITAINAGALTAVATSSVQFLGLSGLLYVQDVFIDNGTDFADPAGAGKHLYVTAKLPTGNGSNNAYATNGSATGTGTGHAAWVSDRPWSSTDFLNQTTGGSLDEDYAIQGAAVGDDDISAPSGATVVARASWQMAQLTGSGGGPTMSIFDNGVVTAFTPAAAFAIVTHITDSATYPVTAPIIGQRSTKGSGKVPALAAAGIVFAYTRPFPIVQPVRVNQAVKRAAFF